MCPNPCEPYCNDRFLLRLVGGEGYGALSGGKRAYNEAQRSESEAAFCDTRKIPDTASDNVTARHVVEISVVSLVRIVLSELNYFLLYRTSLDTIVLSDLLYLH